MMIHLYETSLTSRPWHSHLEHQHPQRRICCHSITTLRVKEWIPTCFISDKLWFNQENRTNAAFCSFKMI